MKLETPDPLQLEHQELRDELAKAIEAGGRVGIAARKVSVLMEPHMAREERDVLPLLALVRPVVSGEDVARRIDEALAMAQGLGDRVSELLADHGALVEALKAMVDAAGEDNRPEYAQFAEKLILHARVEEHVIYPAAIMVGDYLRLKATRRQISEGREHDDRH